jgi:hypothetical protein
VRAAVGGIIERVGVGVGVEADEEAIEDIALKGFFFAFGALGNVVIARMECFLEEGFFSKLLFYLKF